MAYSIQADIEEQISTDELIELTDDTGSNAVDPSVISRAIEDADAEIDSYCGGHYAVPFSSVPLMIRKLSVDMAVYHLFSRRSVLKVPEERQKRYDNAIRFLRDVSKGVISLGANAPADPKGNSAQATRTEDDRIFTIGKNSDDSAGTLDNY